MMQVLVESDQKNSLAQELTLLAKSSFHVLTEKENSLFPDVIIRDRRGKKAATEAPGSFSERRQGFCPVLVLLSEPMTLENMSQWELWGDDFLSAPWGLSDFLIKVRALSRMKKFWDASHYLLTHDSLTGLLNAMGLIRIFEQERERFVRYKTPCSLALADLDHFKAVNDTHGHLMGDKVLQEIASHLSRSVRTLDVVARYGGEEFAVLFPHTDISGAVCACQRLLETVRAQSFSGEIPITLSIGLAALTSSEHSFEDLVHQADQALYRAKNAGRNCLVVGE